MRHLISPNRITIYSIILLTLSIITVFVINISIHNSNSTNVQKSVYTNYPTNYPLEWETQEAAQRQTQKSANLTVFPTVTGTIWLFPLSINTPVSQIVPPATAAGDGFIENHGNASLDKLLNIVIVNSWYANIDGQYITVFSGVDSKDSLQGVVTITINGKFPPNTGRYFTPLRSGAVHIIGARGKRLILQSTGGNLFYFDVPSQHFAQSIDENMITVTSFIEPSPQTTATSTYDAPHNPRAVREFIPVNKPIEYVISYAGEEQWFRFHMQFDGSINVSLRNLPADYDLYVYSVERTPYKGVDGQDTQAGIMPKVIIMSNVPAGDYMIRVVSVNGAYDTVHPYQLEVDMQPLTPVFLTSPVSLTSRP